MTHEYKLYLRAAMREKGLTQAQICKATGIPKSAMSQYVAGIHEPEEDRKALIAETLGIPFDREEVKRNNTLTVDEAAFLLHRGSAFVYKGLQQGAFPWGQAVQTGERSWNYIIYTTEFEKYTGIEV